MDISFRTNLDLHPCETWSDAERFCTTHNFIPRKGDLIASDELRGRNWQLHLKVVSVTIRDGRAEIELHIANSMTVSEFQKWYKN